MKKIIASLTIIFMLATMGWTIPRVSIVKSVNDKDELIVVDNARNSVADGNTFFASRSVSAATQDFSFLVAAGVSPRFTVSAMMTTTTQQYITIAWMESITHLATTGTLITSFNTNRGSTTAATCKLTYSPSGVSSYSTQLGTIVIPVGAGTTMEPRHFNPIPESGWVLKASTRYSFYCVPSSGATAAVNYRFVWAE